MGILCFGQFIKYLLKAMVALCFSIIVVIEFIAMIYFMIQLRSSMAPRSVCFGVRSRKLSNVGQSLDG
jgi:hypothetical protein